MQCYISIKGDHVGLLTFPWSMSVMVKYDKFYLMNCLQCALLANFEIMRKMLRFEISIKDVFRHFSFLVHFKNSLELLAAEDAAAFHFLWSLKSPFEIASAHQTEDFIFPDTCLRLWLLHLKQIVALILVSDPFLINKIFVEVSCKAERTRKSRDERRPSSVSQYVRAHKEFYYQKFEISVGVRTVRLRIRQRARWVVGALYGTYTDRYPLPTWQYILTTVLYVLYSSSDRQYILF